MSEKDSVEFYDHRKHPLGAVDSSIVPVKGSTVALAGKFYKVNEVTFAVDHAADWHRRKLVCAVFLGKEVKP